MDKYLDIGEVFKEVKDKINALKSEKGEIQKKIDDLDEDIKINTKLQQKATYELSQLTIKESELNKERIELENRMEIINEKLRKLQKALSDGKKGGI